MVDTYGFTISGNRSNLPVWRTWWHFSHCLGPVNVCFVTSLKVSVIITYNLGCRHDETDRCGLKWTMTNPDDVPTEALLNIKRRNIRLCVFHCEKRIFSALLDLLLHDWSNLRPESRESTADYELKKSLRRVEFELWARTIIGLGSNYTIACSDKEVPKPIKLDGCHVQRLLANDNWKKGVAILDQRKGTAVVWEVRCVWC